MKIAIVPLFTALSCIFSCNPSNSNSEPNSKAALPQIIRVCNPPVASLHPHTGSDFYCRLYQTALFEGLTRLDQEGKPQLAGATEVQISPSKTVYRFTLRPMRWTNGALVTARNFERGWKQAICAGSDCVRSDLFYSIKNAKKAKAGEISLDEVGIDAVDDQTLVIELEHPAPYFLELVAHPLFSPLFDNLPTPQVFNGPFYLARWDHDQMLVLQKNYSYWDSIHSSLQKIEVSFLSDSHTSLMLFEKGEIDWAGHPFMMLPLDALPRLEQSPLFHSKMVDAVFRLSLNTEKFPLNSPHIRKALSLALDRRALTDHVLLGETPTASIIPTTIISSAHQEHEVDLEKAQILFEEGLKELGLSRKDFPCLKLSHSNFPGQKKLAEAIQENWKNALEIQVTLQAMEWNIFFAALGERKYEIGGNIYYSVFHDPIYALDFFKDKEHRYNTPQWENPRFQSLLDLANQEPNLQMRETYLKEAEQLFLDEMPAIPIYIPHAKYLKSPHVHGIEVMPNGLIDFKKGFIQ